MAYLPYSFEPECDDAESSSSSGNSHEIDSDTGDEIPERLVNSDWCTCGQCVVMPTAFAAKSLTR